MIKKIKLDKLKTIDMMGEKSAEKPKDISFDTWVNMFVGEKQANSEKERINSDGTLYIGEGLENYYIDQLERTGKFKVVSIYATSEEVLQVENNEWIKIENEKPNFDDYCYCWLLTNDGEIVLRDWNPNAKGFYGWREVNFTHYQPIQKPEPPKF